jgi:hypothetical protein
MTLRELPRRRLPLLFIATAAQYALLLLVVVLLLVHGINPHLFELEPGSYVLLSLATLLVLVPVLESAKLPGGTSFKFRKRVAEVEALRVQVERRAEKEGKPLEGPRLAQPGLFSIPDSLRELAIEDPPAALGMLRRAVRQGVAAAVQNLAGFGYPTDIPGMLHYLAAKSRMWPEQVALLKVTLELADDVLLSGRATAADAQRVIAIADTLNGTFPIGYSLNFDPNPDWMEQGRICKYEHCIENMPLPPIPRDEQEEWRAGVQERLEAGAYDDKPELKTEFAAQLAVPIPADAPETVDRTGACPLFGHYCPGGKETVAACEVAQDWAAEMASPEGDQ